MGRMDVLDDVFRVVLAELVDRHLYEGHRQRLRVLRPRADPRVRHDLYRPPERRGQGPGPPGLLLLRRQRSPLGVTPDIDVRHVFHLLMCANTSFSARDSTVDTS